MRPSLLVDQGIDLVTRHPLATVGMAVVAGVLSWLITRTRAPV